MVNTSNVKHTDEVNVIILEIYFTYMIGNSCLGFVADKFFFREFARSDSVSTGLAESQGNGDGGKLEHFLVFLL